MNLQQLRAYIDRLSDSLKREEQQVFEKSVERFDICVSV